KRRIVYKKHDCRDHPGLIAWRERALCRQQIGERQLLLPVVTALWQSSRAPTPVSSHRASPDRPERHRCRHAPSQPRFAPARPRRYRPWAYLPVEYERACWRWLAAGPESRPRVTGGPTPWLDPEEKRGVPRALTVRHAPCLEPESTRAIPGPELPRWVPRSRQKKQAAPNAFHPHREPVPPRVPR